ncbi:MAG TPA: [cytidine(C)-cytidine(C)-adenosine (A)]-adding enzyme, partial [Cyanobacteria bacterium UBA11049]|nr:[cytidine(C)-cytidine(C)-adenosine (A)]-adding enzyme [Cyanobacteria bacterium UBA11049]
DADRQIARVVFPQATVDFALQVGTSLTSDLQRRDFTINAIAYNPHTRQIIDPLQGCHDLQQKVIRMISVQNLVADPLRLLRAYRQAAQLDFSLEPKTQQSIRQLSPYLQSVAAERVQVECSYLLSSQLGTTWLTTAYQDGLLRIWFPAASIYSLAQIVAMDRAMKALIQTWPVLKIHLLNRVNQHSRSGADRRTLLATAKLIGLVSPNPQQATDNLLRLKYSRAEIDLVVLLLQFLPQIQSLSLVEMNRRQQYFFFQKAGRAFPVLAVLAVAWGMSVSAVAPLVNRFLNSNDPVAHPMPLVTGKDLIKQLQLCPGPQVGHLLKQLEIAQAEETITTPQEALALARALVEFEED